MKLYAALPLACASIALMLQAVSAQVIEIQVQPNGKAVAQPAVVQVDADVAVARIAVPFMPGNRMAKTDAVVVGRVVAIEPMDVDAAPAAGQPNVKYRVAVVQVTEVVSGMKQDTQMIRVGFITQGNAPQIGPNAPPQILPAQPAIQPAIQPLPGGRPFIRGMALEVGQDGIFMLNKHHKENFYVVPMYNNFISRQNNPNFDADLKTTKLLAKVTGNPAAALKSDSREERYAAAAVLVMKYRTPENPTGMPGQISYKPIDAAESKLILKAIAEGDWTVGRFNQTLPNPFELFNQLGISQKDGYKLVNIRDQRDVATAMQKWLNDNSDRYVIQQAVFTPIKGGVQPPVNPKIRPPIKGKVQPLPIQIQPLPAPVPQPVPVEILPVAPAVPAPAPLPIRRD